MITMALKTIALVSLATILSAQQSSGPATTKGACSPAITGSHNSIKIDVRDCGMTREQIEEFRGLLKQILGEQIDPKVLLALLGDIKSGQIRIENGVLHIERDITQIRNEQGWPDLTKEDVAVITEAARPFAGQRARIWVSNAVPDSNRLAASLSRVLTSANWYAPYQQMIAMTEGSGDLPLGIELQSNGEFGSAQALTRALQSVFGVSSVRWKNDPTRVAGFMTITIYWKSR